jgi:ABC-type nitrate/sulfonate/bicarbonate transport system substrate-binding protein
VLDKSELEPGRDVTVLPMGGQAGIDAGLEHGAIDAGVIGSNAILRPQQFRRLTPVATLLDYDLYFYTGALVAKKSWIAAHPSETLDVVRAYVHGIAATFQDKAAADRGLAKYTETHDQAALDEAYKLLLRMLRKVPTPQLAAIRTGLAASPDPQAKQADPARFIDPSFVERLQQDGFIEALYKQ